MLGGPQIRSGRLGEEKILDRTGTRNSDPSVLQPVASRYTDYAIPALHTLNYFWKSQQKNYPHPSNILYNICRMFPSRKSATGVSLGTGYSQFLQLQAMFEAAVRLILGVARTV
jgi:hypothetical protein